jgi:hypothetical protein
MAATTVEERLSALELRLEALQRQLDERLLQTTQTKEKRGWQAIVGTFANDPLYDEAMRMGQEWRNTQHDDLSDQETH